MEEAINKAINKCLEKVNENDKNPHGLALFDMPTGFGKTYNTINFIEKYLRKKLNFSKNIEKVIYLTPLNKNLDDTYNDLKERFKDNLEFFNENTILIERNCQAVIDNFNEIEYEIPEEIRKLNSFEVLKKDIGLYKTQNQKDIYNYFFDKISKESEPKFREDLKKYLEDNGIKDVDISSNKEYEWIKKLYPATLIEDKKVIFMNVDKFYKGVDPLIKSKINFLNSTFLKNSIVFIDEIDASKDFILSSMIEESRNNKIELSQFMKSLKDAINNNIFDKNFFCNDKSLENKKNTLNAYNKLKDIINELNEIINLDYNIKIDIEEDNNFIFKDNTTHKIFDKQYKNDLCYYLDEKEDKNIITFKNKKDCKKFIDAINKMDGTFSYFINFVELASKNYLNYYNKTRKNNDKFEYENAINTILNQFNLGRENTNIIRNLVLNGQKVNNKKTKRKLNDLDFYLEGFKIINFENNVDHDTSSHLYMKNLNNTPESFLLNLSGKCIVIGISATSTIETVIQNYDIEYIKSALGNSFIQYDKEDKERIKNKIDESSKNKGNIFTNIVDVKEEDILNGYEVSKLFKSNDNKVKMNTILDELCIFNDKKGFKKIRYLKIIKSIKEFILNSNSKAFLVLTNYNLKLDDNPYSKKNIENIISWIRNENNIEKDVLIHALNGEDFEKEKEEFKKELKENKKVILFSSYPACGTGQNLQYELFDKLKNENIKVDIDSIYIEKPTNILVKIDPNLKEEDKIEALYQIETLKTNGEVSSQEAHELIIKTFKGNMFSKTSKNYDSYSVNNASLKVLIQGVGRICRTQNNSKIDKTIYVDSEIINKLDFNPLKEKFLNKEFEEIIKLSNIENKFTNEEEQLINKGINNSKDLDEIIEYEFLKKGEESWSEENISEWERIREFVLKHPTCLKEEAYENGMSKLYMEYPSNKLNNIMYFYMDNNDSKTLSISFEKDKDNIFEISSQSARLDTLIEVEFIKEYFELKGYATSFKKDELILNPIAFTNIYKGALGEVSMECILNHIGIKLNKITDGKEYEKYDFKDDFNNYFDAKNWSESTKANNNEKREKSLDKLNKVEGNKGYIINIISDNYSSIKDDGKIIQIPRLLKKNENNKYVLDEDMRKKLLDIWRNYNNGNN